MTETSSQTEASKAAEVEIYQFRVYLRPISPEIWRRFLIRSDATGSVTDEDKYQGAFCRICSTQADPARFGPAWVD